MSEFKQYNRVQIAELREYVEGETLPNSVSISQADRDNGSPKTGDMIARNPKNHNDQWLVSKKYFVENFSKKLQPHQVRVVMEKEALDEKINKLNEFINSNPTFINLQPEEKDSLLNQRVKMLEYSDILEERIMMF